MAVETSVPTDTKTAEPQQTCSPLAMIAEVAKRTPDAIAVSDGCQQITYRQLEQSSEAVASYLSEYLKGPDETVAICLERSIELIVGLLGVQKAGAGYVPLDPKLSAQRAAKILGELRPQTVLTASHLLHTFRDNGLVVDVDWRDACVSDFSDSGTGHFPNRSQVAYVIFTSGSTGRPAAVGVSHGALANFVNSATRAFEMQPSDRLLQFASPGFDTSIEEVFSALCSGATLVLRPDDAINSVANLTEFCQKHDVTVLDLPTSFWHLLTSELAAGKATLPPSTRLVIIGGEEAQQESVCVWREKTNGSVKLLNSYGPTETTIVVTFADLSDGELDGVPIGLPIDNVNAEIVSSHEEKGELLIGGAGLARGYLGNPRKTATKFRPHRLPRQPGDRQYATGDIVRELSDGQLVYVGRSDAQIKVRGCRVEPGEIVAELCSHPHIENAFVHSRLLKGGRKIIAYYTVGPNVQKNTGRHQRELTVELRKHLTKRLPEAVVPNHFVLLDKLPINVNGKIMVEALPAPSFNRTQLGWDFVDPRNPTEAALRRLWSDVLALDESDVSIDDEFGYLGGDSLNLMQMRLVARERNIHYGPTINCQTSIRKLAETTSIRSDTMSRLGGDARYVTEYVRARTRKTLFELRAGMRAFRTARVESPHRKAFRDFYSGLANKENIFYVRVLPGVLHWLSRQLEHIPADVNTVLVGNQLNDEEATWIQKNLARPFHNINLQIDRDAFWEFLFETNEYNFGHLDVPCFVLNPTLFDEMASIADDIATNSIWSFTERHRPLFKDYFLFLNIDAIREVRRRAPTVSPASYRTSNNRRSEHVYAFHPIPSRRHLKMINRIVFEDRQELDKHQGLLGSILSYSFSDLHFYPLHLFQLFAQEAGFGLNRVRHLSDPTHWNKRNFFSAEILHALYIASYRQTYFDRDRNRTRKLEFEISLLADYLILEEQWKRLPASYAAYRQDVVDEVQNIGVTKEDARHRIRSFLVEKGLDSPEAALAHGAVSWLLD